jgi:hypothetical protein
MWESGVSDPLTDERALTLQAAVLAAERDRAKCGSTATKFLPEGLSSPPKIAWESRLGVGRGLPGHVSKMKQGEKARPSARTPTHHRRQDPERGSQPAGTPARASIRCSPINQMLRGCPGARGSACPLVTSPSNDRRDRWCSAVELVDGTGRRRVPGDDRDTGGRRPEAPAGWASWCR